MNRFSSGNRRRTEESGQILAPVSNVNADQKKHHQALERAGILEFSAGLLKDVIHAERGRSGIRDESEARRPRSSTFHDSDRLRGLSEQGCNEWL